MGSSPECRIRLPEGAAPRETARILFEKNAFLLEAARHDADVLLNGKRVRSAVLREGDILRCGGIEFTFTHFASPETAGQGGDRGKVLKGLHDFSQALMEAENLDALLERLMDGILAMTGADKGFLVMKEGGAYRVRAARNISGEAVADCSEISDSVINTVTAARKSVLVSDAPGETEFKAAQSILNLKLRSIIAAPVMTGNEVAGVIYLGSERAAGLFDQEDLDAITVIAAQAALIIRNQVLMDRLKVENRNLREIFGNHLVYQSASMENAMRLAAKIAAIDMAVLVTGETGTGKELFAREIHRISPRRDRPFVTVNCSAIPENLVESELFGHLKGAFTGAHADKKGKFELANQGTIFLDEIGDMPMAAQAKLLRVLETGEMETVGGNIPKKVDVRVIAATHKTLKNNPDFRSDLYFRICGVEIPLPRLKERGLDVLIIARSLIEKVNAESGRKLAMTKAAEAAMLKYGWPGNVRELRNRLMRAATLCTGDAITDADLELGAGPETGILPLQEAKEKFTGNYIREILMVNHGNKTRAAQDLGVDARTIYRYLENEE